jgi:hypothetical protein
MRVVIFCAVQYEGLLVLDSAAAPDNRKASCDP